MKFLNKILGRENKEELRGSLSSSKTYGELFDIEEGHSYSYATTDLAISAVYACVKVIAETVATLPLKLYRKDGLSMVEDMEHKLQDLLYSEPNDFQTWMQFKEALLVTALLRGNGYARIIRNGKGQPTSLQFLAEGECQPLYLKWNGYESLVYFVFGEQVRKDDIIHIACLGNSGIIGLSPIQLASQAIEASRQAEATISKFYKNGLRSQAIFSTPNSLKDESFERLSKQLSSKIGEKALLLENGVVASPLTLSPADAEVIATRKFQIEDIARFYRVPLHKIGDLSRSTNNNIEQQSTDFLTDCIIPWCEKVEQEFKRKLLFTREKNQYLFNLDTAYLLRGDSKSRAQYYKDRYACGSITANEIRIREGDNPFENPMADELMVQMQMIPLSEDYIKKT